MPHLSRQPSDPGPEYVARKKAAGLCRGYRCQNKHGIATAGLCYKHYWQHKKRRDLVAYLFHQKKSRANQRGKVQPWGRVPGWPAWTLTLENWREWCAATGYASKTGRKGSSMTLDRKDNRYGYHVWNLAPLTLSQNSRKHTKLGPGVHYSENDDGELVKITVAADLTQTVEILF
jgi:hypothetical protein